MAYGVCKDLPRRTASDKVLRSKVFAIAINPKYDGYQSRIASMVYKLFDKKSKDPTTHTGTEIISKDQQIANESHRPITNKN